MSKTPKIVIIGPAYPYRGGPAAFIANLYQKLTDRFDVEVVSFTRLYPELLFPGRRQEDVSEVPIKPHPVTRVIDSVNPFTWEEATRTILGMEPDLVVFDWYQPFFGICYHWIAKDIAAAGLPTLFITENVISHEERQIDAFLTKLALQHADAYLVLSDAVEEQLQPFADGQPVFSSSLPLFHSRESAPEEWTSAAAKRELGLEGREVVLFFGYIREYKGLRVLMRAFPMVLRRRPDAHLLVVGECYEDVEEYHALIDELDLKGRVTLIDEYVPNEEVPLYYSASDVVALPYRTATQSGILKIAFGYEIPVVITDVGGLAEEVERFNAGLAVPPNDPEAFADALVEFFENPEMQEEMKEGAGLAKRRNDFEAIAEVFEEIIKIDS